MKFIKIWENKSINFLCAQIVITMTSSAIAKVEWRMCAVFDSCPFTSMNLWYRIRLRKFSGKNVVFKIPKIFYLDLGSYIWKVINPK